MLKTALIRDPQEIHSFSQSNDSNLFYLYTIFFTILSIMCIMLFLMYINCAWWHYQFSNFL